MIYYLKKLLFLTLAIITSFNVTSSSDANSAYFSFWNWFNDNKVAEPINKININDELLNPNLEKTVYHEENFSSSANINLPVDTDFYHILKTKVGIYYATDNGVYYQKDFISELALIKDTTEMMITSLIVDDNNNVYAASGSYIYKIYLKEVVRTYQLTMKAISCLVKDENNDIYAAGNSSTLYKLNYELDQFTVSFMLVTNYVEEVFKVTSLVLGANNTIWILTTGAIYKLLPNLEVNTKIECLITKDFIYLTSDTVGNIYALALEPLVIYQITADDQLAKITTLSDQIIAFLKLNTINNLQKLRMQLNEQGNIYLAGNNVMLKYDLSKNDWKLVLANDVIWTNDEEGDLYALANNGTIYCHEKTFSYDIGTIYTDSNAETELITAITEKIAMFSKLKYEIDYTITLNNESTIIKGIGKYKDKAKLTYNDQIKINLNTVIIDNYLRNIYIENSEIMAPELLQAINENNNKQQLTTDDIIFISINEEKAIVEGKGKYCGQIELTYNCKPKVNINTIIKESSFTTISINNDIITLEELIYFINKRNELDPELTVADLEFVTAPTMESAIIRGKGKYCGELELSFNIESKINIKEKLVNTILGPRLPTTSKRKWRQINTNYVSNIDLYYNSIVKTDEGIYVGTSYGLYYKTDYHQDFVLIADTADKEVISLIKDKNDHVHAVLKTKSSDSYLLSITSNPFKPIIKIIKNSIISVLTTDEDSNIYAGSINGEIYKLTNNDEDKNNSQWEYFASIDSFFPIKSLLVTSDNTIYIGSKNAIFKSTDDGNNFNQVLKTPRKDTLITTLIEDEQQQILAFDATYCFIYHELPNSHFKTKKSINYSLITIIPDTKSILLLWSKDIDHLDEKGEITQITDSIENFYDNRIFVNGHKTDDGKIYLITNDGIIYSSEKKQIYNLGLFYINQDQNRIDVIKTALIKRIESDFKKANIKLKWKKDFDIVFIPASGENQVAKLIGIGNYNGEITLNYELQQQIDLASNIKETELGTIVISENTNLKSAILETLKIKNKNLTLTINDFALIGSCEKPDILKGLNRYNGIVLIKYNLAVIKKIKTNGLPFLNYDTFKNSYRISKILQFKKYTYFAFNKSDLGLYYKLTDSNEAFKPVSDLSDCAIYDIVILNKEIYVATAIGIYYATDGINFTKLKLNKSIEKLVINQKGDIYAFGKNHLYLINTMNKKVAQLKKLTRYGTIHDIVFDNNNNCIYLATNNGFYWSKTGINFHKIAWPNREEIDNLIININKLVYVIKNGVIYYVNFKENTLDQIAIHNQLDNTNILDLTSDSANNLYLLLKNGAFYKLSQKPKQLWEIFVFNHPTNQFTNNLAGNYQLLKSNDDNFYLVNNNGQYPQIYEINPAAINDVTNIYFFCT